MTLQTASGTTITQANFSNYYTAVPTEYYTVDEDIYELRAYDGEPGATETLRVKKFRAGQRISLNDIANAYIEPTTTGISPATAGTAGGTTAIVTGTALRNVTSITVGGTAGTAIIELSDTQVQFTVPAKSAGTYSVVVTTPAGSSTLTNAIVYS